MASTGQWTVVKSNKNKNGNANQSKPKNANQGKNLKNLAQGASTLESKTVFNAFLDQDDKEQLSAGKPLNFLVNGADKKKKKPQDKKKVEKKITTVEEALEDLSLKDVKQWLETVQTKFPESPDVWLKDLLTNLNVKLAFDVVDPLFTGKDKEYPSSALKPEVAQFLNKTLSSVQTPVLTSFLEFCLSSLGQDMAKNLHTYGQRVLIQCLTKLHPKLILNIIPKCKEYRVSYQNRQPICLSILWAAGYAGNFDLDVGLKVWQELVLPLISMRTYSKYCTDYLDALLSLHEGKSSKAMGVKDLLNLLDQIVGLTGAFLPVQKQMLEIYPRLKKVCVGSNPELNLRNYFIAYLVKLKTSAHPLIKNELYSGLMECLALDVQCYSLWRQSYLKNVPQSSLLLGYLSEHYDSLPSGFPHRSLKETLKAFQVTNEELITGSKKTPEGVEKCVRFTNDLLARMAAGKFPWKIIIWLLLIASGLTIFYDIKTNGSFDKSLTGKTLHDAGAVSASKQAWAKSVVYFTKSLEWAEQNAPVYYKYIHETSKPCVEWASKKTLEASDFIYEHSQTAQKWGEVNIPPYVSWAKEHGSVLADKCSEHAKVAGSVLESNFKFLRQYYSEKMVPVNAWVQANVLNGELSIEDIHKQVVSLLIAVQDYVIATYLWLGTLLKA